MKSKFYLILLFLSSTVTSVYSQSRVYPVTSGEIIFSQSNSSFTDEFRNKYPDASIQGDNVRFTVFFHFGQYFHYDFNNTTGLYSGLAIRNVGMITDEILPVSVPAVQGAEIMYDNYKIVRRQYMLGLPLAFKFGSFDKHFYAFGGAEYEMAFHLKEKFWTGTEDRSGAKTKDTQWFSNQTPTFLPSVFAGVQFPGGINVKFKYYLTDFLDNSYKVASNSTPGAAFDVSDLTRYKESQIFYVSLCWQFETGEWF